MRQEERGTVKEHAKAGMDMPVLRNSRELVYVSNTVKFACTVDAGRRPKCWLGYCMLI